MHEPRGHGQEEPGGGLALSKADARDKDSNSNSKSNRKIHKQQHYPIELNVCLKSNKTLP